MRKANALKKKKKRKKPSKPLTIRISSAQNSSLLNYCKIHHTTPNKLIKSKIKSFLTDYTDEKIGKTKVDKRQLSLFQEPAVTYNQLTIFSNE